jgi:hypothetical protein
MNEGSVEGLLMNDLIKQNFPLYFPLFFVLMWLSVTTLLGVLSGWFVLMRHYPDRVETPVHTFSGQSGSMNRVSMRSILKLSVCPSGLRVGIMRVFGPFCRDLFVPWNEMIVVREEKFFMRVARITIGQPIIGQLTIPAEVADRIARCADGHWPEVGPFPQEANGQAATRILKQWAVMTIVAAAFFIVAPRFLMPSGATPPPIILAVAFPAIVFGVNGLIQYLRRPRP